ncbi:MAG TPA: hypothetical protein VFV49_00320 [Thermoanaerobaculia bacterium]|nr:hypothetical protein [Thermoanaerobaculia bacterium]
MIPESLFAVTADATHVGVVDPTGQARRTSWSLVERLLIRTTDEGPFLPDVFWEIEPVEEPSLVFPGGATGEAEFLRTAQARLPGFNNDQVIAAMASTSNQEFVVWERDRHCPRCQRDLPRFPQLTHAHRLELRRIIDTSGPIDAIKRLREMSGCDLKTAKLWVHHRGLAGQGHAPITPCPHCGEPLRSAEAKQCRFCKRDWHDPARIRSL